VALSEEVLYNRLSNHAGLNALVPASRIFYVKKPAGAVLPAVTYFRVYGQRVESMTGSSALAFARFQVDAWAKTYPEVKAVAEQVRMALQGYKGTFSGTTIQGINYLGDQDLYEDDAAEFRVLMEFLVHHNEDIPT
jgi:hypothetical protein